MSKALLFVMVPVVVGLAAWNVVLSSEVDELRNRVAEAAPRAEPSAKPGPAAPGAGPSRDAPVRTDPRIAELEARLAEMERRVPAAAPPRAAAPADTDTNGAADPVETGVPVPAEWDSDAFRAAVGRVLEAREEARRQDRTGRTAENLARMWFRDLELTGTQRADALRVLGDSLRRMEEVRQDESLTDDQRRQEFQRIQEERLTALGGVLDAAQMETVRQRVGARLRRGGAEGPGGAGRGLRPPGREGGEDPSPPR